MTNLRTMVIAKTDIAGFTPRSAKLSEAELDLRLSQHKEQISNIVVKNDGTIIKGEGDAFWITFPSVTIAILAGIEIHQLLEDTQAGRGEEQCLKIRMAIAVGDVLVRENDIFGSTVNLVARIEGVTPPNEIYLSHAAWLVLNQAEVPTIFVNSFALKGFEAPESIYKVEQKHRTRIVKDQVIVLIDARGLYTYIKNNSIASVEVFLLAYDDLVKDICQTYGGIIRNFAGDNYLLTFLEADKALAAVDRFISQWKKMASKHKIGLLIGIHRGEVYILRSSYVYSPDIFITSGLTHIGAMIIPDMSQCSVIISEVAIAHTNRTLWENRLHRIEKEQITIPVYQDLLKHCPYHFEEINEGLKEQTTD